MVEESQYGYATLTGWGWVFMGYFFGAMVTFLYAVFTMDDLTYSKKKKFSWSAWILALIFTAFSWFGFAALMKFDKKNYGKYDRY